MESLLGEKLAKKSRCSSILSGLSPFLPQSVEERKTKNKNKKKKKNYLPLMSCAVAPAIINHKNRLPPLKRWSRATTAGLHSTLVRSAFPFPSFFFRTPKKNLSLLKFSIIAFPYGSSHVWIKVAEGVAAVQILLKYIWGHCVASEKNHMGRLRFRSRTTCNFVQPKIHK